MATKAKPKWVEQLYGVVLLGIVIKSQRLETETIIFAKAMTAPGTGKQIIGSA